MSLAAGTRLGPYEVLGLIGAGGMGEVYRARDTRLGREVAIKVLPELVAQDPERLVRFEREARVLASLSHSRIAAIYALEHIDRVRFLVLELAVGESLAVRLAGGPLPVREAIDVARQIAEGLDAAHEKGVVHRDLKPGNINIASDGQIKILDFGLAKALAGDSAAGDPAESPTITSGRTRQGVILGTAAYMSPEQARGMTVDRRTDIWAFGCVLYECLTGRRAFPGQTISDAIAAVLDREPDWTALPATTPADVRVLLTRCLRKDARERLRDIGDLRIALDDVPAGITDGRSSGPPRVSSSRWLTHALWAGACLAAVAGSLGYAWRARPASPAEPVRRFEIVVADLQVDTWTRPRVSPDGRMIAYGAGGRLQIRPLESLAARDVPASDGGETPFWSPTGHTLAFARQRKLWRIGAFDDTPRLVCDLPETGRIIAAVWRDDDTILFSAWQGSVYSVSARGGDPKVMLEKNATTDVDLHELSLLPGGKGLLFVPHGRTRDLYRIEVLADGKRKVLVHDQANTTFDCPQYSPTGHLLYQRRGSNNGIWAVPFSLASLEVTGEPFRIAADGGIPELSTDGTLMYTVISNSYQLAWLDRRGKLLGTVGEPQGGLTQPALSPDGTRVAVAADEVSSNENNHDIWVYDVASGRRVRLLPAVTPTNDLWPQWTTDGRNIVYVQGLRSPVTIVTVSAGGGRTPRDLVASTNARFQVNRQHLLYSFNSSGGPDLWDAALSGDLNVGPARPLLQTPAAESAAQLSPDGVFLAYQSDESGEPEIYLRRFPVGEERWPVSTAGGQLVRWNGAALLFRSAADELVSAALKFGQSVQVGQPVKLFGAEETGAVFSRGWDMSADGQRFLVVRATAATRSGHIVIVQNWFQEFRKE